MSETFEAHIKSVCRHSREAFEWTFDKFVIDNEHIIKDGKKGWELFFTYLYPIQEAEVPAALLYFKRAVMPLLDLDRIPTDSEISRQKSNRNCEKKGNALGIRFG